MIQCFGEASIAVAVLDKLKDENLHKGGIAIPMSDTEKALEVLKHAPGRFKGKLNPIVPMPDKSGGTKLFLSESIKQITAFLSESTEDFGENKVIFVDYNSNGKDLSKHREEIKSSLEDKAGVVGIGPVLAEEAIRSVQCQAMSQIRHWRWQEFIALSHLKESILEQHSVLRSNSLMNRNDSTKIVNHLKESSVSLEWLPVPPQDPPSNPSVEKDAIVPSPKSPPETERWHPSVLGGPPENEQGWLQRLKEVANTKGLFSVRFEEGWPVKVEFGNEKPIEINVEEARAEWEQGKDYYQIVKKANAVGREHGVGFQIYPRKEQSPLLVEAPGIALLEKCYEYLLQLILDRRARRYYQSVTRTIAERIFEESISGSESNKERLTSLKSWLDVIKPITRLVSGTIEVALYKGNVAFHKASDVPHSLYSEETASMEAIGDFDHVDSEGFLGVLGIGARASAVAGQTQE